jgi:hypothetical protein
MKPVSVHVDEERYEQFRALARRSGRPVAALIREAMNAYVESRRGEGPSLLDLPPLSAGRPLTGWTRAEIYDEMFSRKESAEDVA